MGTPIVKIGDKIQSKSGWYVIVTEVRMPSDSEPLGAVKGVHIEKGYQYSKNQCFSAPNYSTGYNRFLEDIKEGFLSVEETLKESWDVIGELKKQAEAAGVGGPVVKPNHYNRGKIEVIDFIYDQGLNFGQGNAVKYICRAGFKDPEKYEEDIKKAIEYLQRDLEIYKSNKNV